MVEKVTLTNGQMVAIKAALGQLSGLRKSKDELVPYGFTMEARWKLAILDVSITKALGPFEVAKTATAKAQGLVEGMPVPPMSEAAAKVVTFFEELGALKTKTVDLEIEWLTKTDFGNNPIPPTVLADLMPIIKFT